MLFTTKARSVRSFEHLTFKVVTEIRVTLLLNTLAVTNFLVEFLRIAT